MRDHGTAALLIAPEKIADVVSMSGSLLPEVLPHAASVDARRDKPVLIVHGERDENARHSLRALGSRVARTFAARADVQEVANRSHDYRTEHRLRRARAR